MIWRDHEFICMVVGGPNSRTDYHINQGEEFFHQIEGDMVLKIIEQNVPVDISIREGDIFLLPPGVPHSPRRPAGSVGLVIERERRLGEKDSFLWLCESCGHKLYEESIELKNIEIDLPPVFNRFYSDVKNTSCQKCGRAHAKN